MITAGDMIYNFPQLMEGLRDEGFDGTFDSVWDDITALNVRHDTRNNEIELVFDIPPNYRQAWRMRLDSRMHGPALDEYYEGQGRHLGQRILADLGYDIRHSSPAEVARRREKSTAQRMERLVRQRAWEHNPLNDYPLRGFDALR